VKADGRLLKGIRGGGGGVIVELTIKAYPLKTVGVQTRSPRLIERLTLNQILAGAIFYDSRDLNSTFRTFNVAYQEFAAKAPPPQLMSIE
jgi:hypothetical protein